MYRIHQVEKASRVVVHYLGRQRRLHSVMGATTLAINAYAPSSLHHQHAPYRYSSSSPRISSTLLQQQQERPTKKEISKRNNAARSLPYWLGKEPDCFAWTMEALQLNPGNAMEYRQLYLDSLVSFYQTITTTTETPSPRMVASLQALVDAGFDDLHWASQFRKMKVYENEQKILRKRIRRNKRQCDEKVLHAEMIREEIQELERKLEEDSDQSNDDEDDDDDEEEEELDNDDDNKSNDLITGMMNTVSSIWGGTVVAAEPPAVENENTLLPRPTRRTKRLNRKLEKRKTNLMKAEEEATRKKEQLERLEKELKALDPVISLEEYESVSNLVMRVLREVCCELAVHMQSRHKQMIDRYKVMDSKTDLTKPHEWYMHARLDRRKIIFHGGPTNSGKTYSALQRLKQGKKGLYVGPLRLLAAEVYETLTSQGVYTNLFTGQESREIPFATHCAATVELAPTNEDFDVVVIDEIQMMKDPSRGFAWTRALLGIRCKEIHVCGGMEAVPLVKKIAKDCGDEFELHSYERFAALEVEDKSLSASPTALGSYKHVQPGDCVVAFSRADIFAIKREIEELTDYKCCVIYGSLPPETRTDQARRFNNADSGYDVLVASDAIGMGLNLNIRRIIFNTMFKSNGERIIRLDHSSVKQIAGRAGRRNSPFPEGTVTCRDHRDMDYLRKCMQNEIRPIQKAGLLPTAVHIELFSAAMQTYGLSKDHDNLHKMLTQFAELATLQGDFFLCRQSELLSIARLVTDLQLPLKDKYSLCMAPVSVRNERGTATLRRFAVKLALGEVSGLSRQLVPKPAKSFDDMGRLCEVHMDLDLFLWLQHRFPGNAMEHQSALAMKERTISYINKGLRDTEKLKLAHCYIKRDTRLRQMAKKHRKKDDEADMDSGDPFERDNVAA